MDYNPHNASLNRITQRITQLVQAIESKTADVQWHKQFDIAAKQAEHAAALAAWRQQNHKLQRLQAARLAEQNALQVLTAGQKTLLNPLNWLNVNVWANYRQKRQFLKQLGELNLRIAEQAEVSQQCAAASQAVMRSLDKYHAMDLNALTHEIAQLAAQQDTAVCEQARIAQLKKAADLVLGQPMYQLHKALSELALQRNMLQQASQLERQLNSAVNSYQRKLVHQQCSNVLGNARPGAVMQKAERSIESINRTVAKLEQRLKQLHDELGRDIRTLIIDGNNMCYQHNRFVGLQPLLAFIGATSANYQLKVVFDASIRRLLQAGNTDINRLVNGNNQCALVHVVATRQTADETILRLASADSYSYVVSNDAYRDFAELPCVAQKRLIRHEIVDNKVFVHSLAVDVTFTTAYAA